VFSPLLQEEERVMRNTTAMRAALAAAAFTLGCSPPTSPLDLVGTYSLRSVSGSPLPYQLPQTGATRIDVLDDVLILTSSSSYSEMGHKTYTTAGIVSLAAPVDAGSFHRKGDAITLESLLFGQWSGTIDGGTLTMVQQGFTLVYQK
jgi:hypothetical protein